MTYEVVVPTRGDNLAPLLAGLIQWAPFPLRLITERYPRTDAELMLLESLYRLGCGITLQQQHGGVGNARAMFVPSRYDVVVGLDDDVVVGLDWKHQREGLNPFAMLAEATAHYPWSIAIIRFAQNFREPLPGHTEVWEEVGTVDPRVLAATKARGEGWANRVYDFGTDVETDQLSGACFAVRNTPVLEALAPQLRGWTKGGSDQWLGRRLGGGIALSGVYAYHFGRWTLGEWGYAEVGHQLLMHDPQRFSIYAKEMRARHAGER